jgi:DNA-binding CsgD family transcriptional regulator
MSAPLFGREPELAAGRRFLESLQRESRALIIEGDAGAGKTALWRAIVEDAERRGCRVLEARPTESESTMSYAALSDLLGGEFDRVRGRLAEPQERALAAALVREPVREAVDLRATGMGLVTVLDLVAADMPVVVAVDDVQWLDAATERALHFAARRLPPRVGLLLARRGDGRAPLPLGLRGAPVEARAEQVMVGPLSLAALHHLITERLGSSLTRPLLVRVAALSAGNPFVALEMARALISEPADRPLAGPLPMPGSVRDLLNARIDDLSIEARTAVLIASALFRPTGESVGRASEDASRVEAALIEAEEAGVIASERGRLRFTHPLLASAVYSSASETRRRQLHRRLATVIDDPEQRATHLALSTTEPDEPTASEIEQGATQASWRGAQDRAAELFDAALRLTPDDSVDARARRALGQATALNAVGDFAPARALAERALALSVTPPHRVAALSLLASLSWFSGAASEARERLEEALTGGLDDAVLLGAVHAKLVRFSLTLDLPGAARHADAAAPLLDEARDPVPLAHVLLDRFFAAIHLGDGPSPELLDRGLDLEARALAGTIDPPHPYPLIWFHSTDAFDRARSRYAMEDEWYRQRGEEVWRADRRSHLAVGELRAGRWELAETLAEQACDALAGVEVRGPFALVFEKRALVDAHHGRTDRARAALVPLIERFESVDQPWWAALALSTLAFVEFVDGDHAAVDRALVRMRRHAAVIGGREIPTDRSEAFHVESLLALGQPERARKVLGILERRAEHWPRPWIAVALPRARALMRAHDGDVAGALTLIDDADCATGSPAPFEAAWTLLVKGRLLRRDRQKRAAADVLQQALVRFEQLGARPWVETARHELQRVGLRPAAPLDLTESERRVAQLVAGGMTNREVAAALFMSPKTVEATLGRAYRKLGIHSRAELGARFADSGDPATNRGDRPIPS